MDNQKIRRKIEDLFGLPAMNMNWAYYMAQLNEAGKITAKSTLDMIIVILTSIESMEENISNNKLLTESLKKPEPVIVPVIEPEVKPTPKAKPSKA